MLGSYDHVAAVIRGIMAGFNWNIVSLLYHEHGTYTGKGHSDCFFSLGSVQRNVKNKKQHYKSFDEQQKNDFKKILEDVKNQARSELSSDIFS